ncbi:hypothetical protein BGZ61DRAFT_524782 [Ilyonectria robusta]|uniref:uncharacterized protein n=1 Tax=Ilyonectria robusta TaxID=1079257 RepID=UPI001E8E70E2|nr:uncharacterized protein BGZ61DRAFT_524782 [Ilyonectria robusta]KAH8648224.1 hypothetical protein BGZ61DRAFT_524782 [Ilyonectria robusta]
MDQDVTSAGPEDPNFRRVVSNAPNGSLPARGVTDAVLASSIGGTHKSKEPRQWVLISHQYERKIDLIEERLDGIEDALWAIAAGGTIIGSNRVSQRSAAPSTASRSLRSIHPQAAQTEVEDEDKDESDSVVGVD